MVAKEAKWSLAGSLQAACSRGDERVVNLLLDKDADVNAAGGYRGAALQAACEQGYQHIVEILLRDGKLYKGPPPTTKKDPPQII
jgi:ankyrin repeat protein